MLELIRRKANEFVVVEGKYDNYEEVVYIDVYPIINNKIIRIPIIGMKIEDLDSSDDAIRIIDKYYTSFVVDENYEGLNEIITISNGNDTFRMKYEYGEVLKIKTFKKNGEPEYQYRVDTVHEKVYWKPFNKKGCFINYIVMGLDEF